LVEQLPAQQKTALVLKFQEDMKIEDIAIAMGKSAGAVKLLIHRGVSRLREDADALRPVE
jgi:DNA-directed RNA polymerase specialized sigma24 family protein